MQCVQARCKHWSSCIEIRPRDTGKFRGARSDALQMPDSKFHSGWGPSSTRHISMVCMTASGFDACPCRMLQMGSVPKHSSVADLRDLLVGIGAPS